MCSLIMFVRRVMFPTKLGRVLEVDSQQKLVARFSLKDKATGKGLQVHQAFMRFQNKVTNQEIIFIADTDSNIGTYRFDLVRTSHLFVNYEWLFSIVLLFTLQDVVAGQMRTLWLYYISSLFLKIITHFLSNIRNSIREINERIANCCSENVMFNYYIRKKQPL